MSDRRQLSAHLGADVDDADHVGQFGARRHLKPAMRLFHRAGGREGPEGLALLDHGVDAVAHLGTPGIGQDAAIAERARAVLHAAAEPGDDAPIRNQPCRAGAGLFERVEALPLDLAVEAAKRGLDFALAVLRAQRAERGSGDWESSATSEVR